MATFVKQLTKVDAKELSAKLIETCSPEAKFIEMMRMEDVLVVDIYKEDCLATIAFSDYTCMVSNVCKGGEVLDFSAIFDCYCSFMKQTFDEYEENINSME